MQLWKLGCRWESGSPLLYDFIKDNKIVIGWVGKDYSVGDYLLLTDGYTVLAFAEILEIRKSILEFPNYEETCRTLRLPFNEEIFVYKAKYIVLNEEDRFEYPLQQGIVKVQGDQYLKTFLKLKNQYEKMEQVEKNVDLLSYKKQIILQGPPGTGKTRLAEQIAMKILGLTSTTTISKQDIVKYCRNETLIPTAKTKLNFTIMGTNERGVIVKNSEGKEYTAPYSEILKMYQNQAWLKEGLIVNGTDSYSAAVAKYMFGIIPINQSKLDLDNYKIIQFHPSYGYEDFVRGIVAESDGEKIEYRNVNKTLGLFAEQAFMNYKLSKAEDSNALAEEWVIKAFEEFKNEIEIQLQESEIKLSGGITIFQVTDKSFKYGKSWESPSHINFLEFKAIIKQIVISELVLENFQIDKTKFVHAFYRITYYKALLELFFKKHTFKEATILAEPKNFVLVIDEINRANLSSVLGELIYALEYRGKEVDSIYKIEGNSKIVLPPNLYIIGTMNTADRSVGHIDYAIRRRFAFVNIEPIELQEDEEIYFNSSAYKKVAALFNRNNVSIEFEPRDVQIGHSYFIAKKIETPEDLKEKVFKLKMDYEVVPILNEYIKDGVLIGEIEGKSVKEYVESLKLNS